MTTLQINDAMEVVREQSTAASATNDFLAVVNSPFATNAILLLTKATMTGKSAYFKAVTNLIATAICIGQQIAISDMAGLTCKKLEEEK